MSTRRRTVLFDVDGTLVDSNYLHTVAWSRALADAGEWAPMNAIHRLIGMGSDTFLPTLIGRADELIADGWKAHYDKLIGEVRAFPESGELLRDLAAAGVTVVLATSAPTEHLAYLVSRIEADGSIDTMTTADDVQRSKPDPEIFLTAMERSGGDADSTFVVGDSVWDIEAATAARLPCVAVESGGFSEAELTDAGAIAVYRDVAAIRHHLGSGALAALLD